MRDVAHIWSERCLEALTINIFSMNSALVYNFSYTLKKKILPIALESYGYLIMFKVIPLKTIIIYFLSMLCSESLKQPSQAVYQMKTYPRHMVVPS